MKKLIALLLWLWIAQVSSAQGIYNLWGMTAYGGPTDAGVIFKTDSRGNNFQKVFDFSSTAMAYHPYGSLTFFNGKLYGIAGGGADQMGSLFEFDPFTYTYTTLVDFNDTINGYAPLGTLVLDNSKLYGICSGGGIYNSGVIFEWNPVANIYSKKIDFSGPSGPNDGGDGGSLILVNNKFYGMTHTGGFNNEGVLFEWDPIANIYSKKLDFTGLSGLYPSPYESTLELKDGKLYGTGLSGGASGLGVIFEWDPATDTYTKKFDFGGIMPWDELGSSPSGVTLCGDKLYGVTMDGGTDYNMGLLYEWDPATDIYTVKQQFDDTNTGRWPMEKLGAVGGRLYGMLSYGGLHDKGLLFEFDPATNTLTKKLDFDGLNAGVSEPENTIIGVPAPVANISANNCTSFASVAIDSSNNSAWVPITDNFGNAIAEIRANGNNLGVIDAQVYVNGNAPREDGAKRLYLDRNFTITPQSQPSSPVDVRFYITEAEFETLKAAINSAGHPSGVNTIEDLAIFKTSTGCTGPLTSDAYALATTGESWSNGYVLTASVNSFSSFYFSSKSFSVLPLSFLSFNVTRIANDALLNWEASNETSSSHFEIERSLDGHNYGVIGRLYYDGITGRHTYSFVDRDIDTLQCVKIYYRIEGTTASGSSYYSPIVVLTVDNHPGVSLYPNPVTDKANLIVTTTAPGQFQARILDAMGRIVTESRYSLPAGRTSVSLDLKKLVHGVYFLEVKGSSIDQKIIFVK